MKVLFTFNSEGAGHASRSIAIAKELDNQEIDIYFAGAGAGLKFIRLNGFPYFEVSNPLFHEHLNNSNYRRLIYNFLPKFMKKTEEYRRLVENFDLVVSDNDYPSVIASIFAGTQFVYISHDLGDFYPAGGSVVEIWNKFSLHHSADFIFPNIFLGEEKLSEEIKGVGPLAYVENSPVNELDVLLVPSQLGSQEFQFMRNKLQSSELEVKSISEEDWEIAPNLYPFIKSASVVICSGYSTVMECSLANTPSIILPKTPEQKFIAERLKGRKGFYVGSSPEETLKLVDKNLNSPEDFPNGAREASKIIWNKLS